MLGMLSEQTISSIQVAEMMGKNHADLLRDIVKYEKYLAESKIALGDFFLESQYFDKNKQERPCYQITRKGCEFLAHKMTGQKGAMFTAWYIEAFHKMQEQNREEQSFPLAETVDQLLRSQMVMAQAMERILQRLEEPKRLSSPAARDEIIYEGEMERIWENEREQARSFLSQALTSLASEADVLLDSDERARAFRTELERMLLATPSPNVLLSMDKVISFCERMEDYANLRLEAGYVLGLEKGIRLMMQIQSGGLARFLLSQGIL